MEELSNKNVVAAEQLFAIHFRIDALTGSHLECIGFQNGHIALFCTGDNGLAQRMLALGFGRSTFYAHFETKDELLRSMCTDIFHHVFTEELPQEHDHDYSAGSKSLELKLGHVLYRLRENRLNLKGLLASESGELFLSFLKDYLRELFARYLHEFHSAVPEDYLLHHLTGSFAETVKWWVAQDMVPTPESVAGYYIAVIRK